MLKGLDGLRQEVQDLDEEEMQDMDKEETQPADQVKKVKIKIPPLKPRAYEGDPIDVRPQKRQCR